MLQQTDYGKEKEKRFICFALGILCYCSVLFIMPNSIFFKNYVAWIGRRQYSLMTVSSILCIAGFLFTGIGCIASAGNSLRGRKLMALKKTFKEESRVSGGYVSVNNINRSSHKYVVYEKRCKAFKVLSAVTFGIATVCFIVVFCTGDVAAAFTELMKDEIDRVSSDFRVWSDLLGKFFAYVGIIFTCFSVSPIMANKHIPKPCVYVSIGCLGVSSVQLAYFFFGDIFVFPCVGDFCILLVMCLMIALNVFSLITDRVKNTLASIGNNEITEF